MFAGRSLRVRAVLMRELWELVRQPQLLLLLLVGPILIMVVFALSFRAENVPPTAVVVVEPGSEGEALFEEFRGRFVSHVDFEGTVESVERADAMIERGEVQAAVIIPSDPFESIRRGQRAAIGAHYSTINPVFGATVPNRTRGLVFDLNNAVVRSFIAREIGSVEQARERVGRLQQQLAVASAVAGSLATEEARQTTADLDETLGELEGSLQTLQEAGADGEVSRALEQTRTTRELLGEVRSAQAGGAEAIRERSGLVEAQRQLDGLQAQLERVPGDISPAVLASPFEADLKNLAPFQPQVVGFYAPGVLAILLQHVAISLASLSLVRERLSGAYEFFSATPLGTGELLAGKFAAYLVAVLAVHAGVVVVLVRGLDVPLNGGVAGLVAAMVALTVASLGVGFALSALSRTRLQAIQVSMLLLLGSVFFAGFLFPLSELGQPARGLAFLLPATYGIGALQDVMIRGEGPGVWSLVGMAVMAVVSLGIARFMLRRKRA